MPRATPRWFAEYVPQEVQDSSLFRFQVQCQGQAIDVDLRADLDVDGSIVEQQLEDIPSTFAYWASVYSELKTQCAKVERKIKARRGKLADALIREMTGSGLRVTDNQVKTVIEGDDMLNKLEDALLVLEKNAGKLYYILEALRMKAENLRSLSGFAKIEKQQQGN